MYHDFSVKRIANCELNTKVAWLTACNLVLHYSTNVVADCSCILNGQKFLSVSTKCGLYWVHVVRLQ